MGLATEAGPNHPATQRWILALRGRALARPDSLRKWRRMTQVIA